MSKEEMSEFDEGDYNLFTGPGRVNQIPEEDNFLLAGQSSGWHGSRAFLQGNLLVVAVNSLESRMQQGKGK